MSLSEPLLERSTIERVLNRLAERLDRRGVTADLYVFGGAAMAMAYDARRATRDIDAVFVPLGVVLEEHPTARWSPRTHRLAAGLQSLPTDLPDEPLPGRARLLIEELFDA